MELNFKTLNFGDTIKDSFEIGIKNAPSIVLATILWLVTIWVPYINLGTTIALSLIPMELAKGNVINPLGIFDSKYRRYMGEYLIASALMSVGIIVAMCFMFVPAIVLSVAWTLTYYFMFEKGKNPIQAIKASNDATYGSKWTMFGVMLVVGIILGVLFGLIGGIMSVIDVELLTVLVMLIIFVISISVFMAVSASFWKQLKNNVE